MNTFLSRANNVFAFTLTVLAALTFGCFLSTVFKSYNRHVDLKAVKVVVKHVRDFSVTRETNDLGIVNVDLKADLNDLFDWNTKQLFVYLTAEYTSAKYAINQVVLWDKIIQRGDNAILNYENLNSDYYFFDDGDGLRALAPIARNMRHLRSMFRQYINKLILSVDRRRISVDIGNKNVTLYLSWNVIPNAGLLPRIFVDDQTYTFAFPDEYSPSRAH